jgi:flagellar biogenesis protein FliO
MEQNVLIQGGGGKTVLFLTFVNMLGLLLLIYFGSYLLHRHRVKRLAAAEKQG